MTKSIRDTIKKFSSLKILIIGDIMLDSYITGEVKRISPEAPVPILTHKKNEYRLGGAANVALNLSSLGVTPILIGSIGKDDGGGTIKSILKEKNISIQNIIENNESKTSIKTRMIANNQQLLRLDEEDLSPISTESTKTMINLIKQCTFNYDGCIISDYGKGIITKDSYPQIINILKKRDIPVIIDPKKKNVNIYKDSDGMTPNHFEAEENSGLPCDTDEEVQLCGQALIKKHNLKHILITRGAKGMSIITPNGETDHIPTFARSVFDVSGAGDTVIALLTAALATKLDLHNAAKLANYGAGIVVSKFGTATVTTEELTNVLD